MTKPGFEFKKFSPKGLHYIKHSNHPINIAHGAVRSSKTINTTLKWLYFLADSPHQEFMQSGKTRRSLYRNVLKDQFKMLDTFGIEYEHLKSDGQLTIEDKTIWLVGFKDESVTDIIRGMTIGGWYGDETNTYTKQSVEEALDRCSLDGSQVYWTMNPDSPYHFINQDYILNEDLLKSGDVGVWHYTLNDNPNLPPDYVERIKRRYPKGSVQYKRKILGLWVIAEGVIYDRFIESEHTFKNNPFQDYDYYVISTDYGSGNVTVFGLFGIRRTNNGNHYHLLKEFYYDVTAHSKQLTDKELIDKAMELLHPNIPLHAFFTPHDAASLRAELAPRFYQGQRIPIHTYTPKVLDDIHTIQQLIVDKRFMIHESCTDSISQAQTYAWDPKAQQRGEDKPLKVNDHCPDMWRAAVMGTRGLTSTYNDYARSKKRYKFSKNQTRR